MVFHIQSQTADDPPQQTSDIRLLQFSDPKNVIEVIHEGSFDRISVCQEEK